MKTKYKIIVVIALVVVFILNLRIGCPGNFNSLLRYMFHEDFPMEYEVIKKSETTLFQYIFSNRECKYEIQISQEDHDYLLEKIISTGYWRVLHPDWAANPCLYMKDKYCDKDSLENIKKLKGTSLICYAKFLPNNVVMLLKCYDY